jgi:thiol-disulfide isomerase/thioredoxin
MKKNILIAFLMIFFVQVMISQVVTDKQYILVSKITADWCPKCGDYGWSMFKDLEKEYLGKDVIVLAVHKSSSGIKTKTSETIAETFGGFGQPLYFINDAEKEGINSDNWKTKLAEIKDDLSFLSLSNTAFLGVNTFVQQKSNGKFKVIVKAKSFENINVGEYFAGVYLVNDNLIAPQATQSSEAKHTGALRENILGEESAFGVKLLSSPLKNGDEAIFEKDDVEINMGNQNPKDFRIVTILWNKRNDKFVFNNAAVSSLSALLSSNEAYEENANLIIRYDINSRVIEVTDNTNPINEYRTINLYNPNGQPTNINIYDIQDNSLKISLLDHVPGVYYLRLGNQDKSFTKSVLVLE